MRLLALCLGLGLLGCSRQPHARSVVGPDGTSMVHVACGSDQSACFELAGQSCPSGYTLFPIFDPHDNNFLVRCQPSSQPRATVALGAPLAVPNAQAPESTAPPQSAAGTAFSTLGPQDEPLSRATLEDSATDWGY
jgi:hypothetical protein